MVELACPAHKKKSRRGQDLPGTLAPSYRITGGTPVGSISADDGLWFRRYHTSGEDGLQLVCFPHAGGSASFFRPLSGALSPMVEVLAVQYPGRQDRRAERRLENISELADATFDALTSRLDRPTALFGHSMGAVLAFEVANRMEHRKGTVPVRLFASGRRAPSRYVEENVHQRDDEALVAELRNLSGTDTRLLDDEEVRHMILPVLRSDYKAVETYCCPPDRSVGCPITVLVGDADPRVARKDAEAWAEHTAAGLDLHIFSGGHFYLGTAWSEVCQVITAGLGPRR
ncbi:thioesterase [Longimycelium tulufanense]|uniref:Thioesterase n=1 Tax=Longimycelium tulufanense TaxID=907463 RepID=A0A8J3FX83_9PSEU|nr:alpha/beta fold hydrolase [Longimycelium tulufanense]GGM84205.1 thioesterase [Longimycelium tulufanense]